MKRAVKNCVDQIGDAIGAAKRTLPRGAFEAMAKMLEQMLRDERIVRDERGSRPLTQEDIDAAGVRGECSMSSASAREPLRGGEEQG